MREKRPGEKRGVKKAATKKTTKKETVSVKAKKAPAEKKATKAGAEIKKKKTTKRTAPKDTKKIKTKVKKKVTASPVKKETKAAKARIKVKKETKTKKVIKRIEEKVIAKKVIKKPAKKIEAKKVALPKKAVLKKPGKISTPVRKGIYPPLPMWIIPEEYGEDAVALMTVDPRKLFIYWEVTEDTLAKHKGDITVRLYDITGIDFDGMNANSYLDLTVDKRIGDLYMDVHPGQDYVADIGIKDLLGIFISIARSNKATTPLEGMAEEGKVLHPKLYETGLPIPPPIGYEK
jgi:hypothetical protein